MGEYVYKVTGKVVRDKNGEKANQLVYAFKPYTGWSEYAEKANNRMYRQSGCYAADRYVKHGKKWTGRAVLDEGGPSIAMGRGTITDYAFDSRVMREAKNA